MSEGTVIDGKYRLERLLGRGGMGAVYAARHLTLGELYAIKFVTPGPGDRDEAHARFRREAKSAALLVSDHVAKVMDVGVHGDDDLYIVMEYLEGMDLEVLARKRGPLPYGEAATYAAQTCAALAEAHAKNVIHRDIKLANLFVSTGQGEPLLKVLDFGVSKTMGTDLTQTAAVLGSPKYMSPEQMDDPRTVDGRTDVWSLGVVLYRLVSGRLPFDGETLGRICMAVMREPPPPLALLRPDLPPAFIAIVDRCLEKDRARRFSTVQELAAGLAPFATPLIASAVGASDVPEPTDAATIAHATLLSVPRVDTSQNRTWSKTGALDLAQTTVSGRTYRASAALVGGLAAVAVVVFALGVTAALRTPARPEPAAADTSAPPVAAPRAASTMLPSAVVGRDLSLIPGVIPADTASTSATAIATTAQVAPTVTSAVRRAPPAIRTAPPRATTRPGAPLIPEDRR